MDPATALSIVTGEYKEDIDSAAAFEEIIKAVSEAGKNEKDFILVESEIMKACRRPCVIEIQEPACIARPATLVRLNGLLDNGRQITLIDGETVQLNPNTVFVFTTNSDYKGCRDINESVLSRMDMIIDYSPITVDELVKRAMRNTGIDQGENENVRLMAELMVDIQNYCREQLISDGVCGPREFENWVLAYMVKKDILEACKSTVISKASKRREAQQDILDNVISVKI